MRTAMCVFTTLYFSLKTLGNSGHHIAFALALKYRSGVKFWYMAKQKSEPDPQQYIVPLNMNGLQGRMLRLPATGPHKDRELLVIYGHHALLERWWGLVQNFALFGNVTMPDLPGFGGMDSFYKVGQKPTIDNLADYLASFIKLRYKRRKVVIIGISFGFVVVTRMLQRYPHLAKRVEYVISTAGFAHHDDFVFSKKRMFWYRTMSHLMHQPTMPFWFRLIAINPWVLRVAYAHTHNAKKKFAAAASDDLEAFSRVMDMEVVLWRINDVKTHHYTTCQFLRVDNCKKHIDVPVYHVYVKGDYYFNNSVVEQHLRVIYNDYQDFELDLDKHAPSVIATKEEAAEFLPPPLRRLLERLPTKK